jgi:hypothetical protein
VTHPKDVQSVIQLFSQLTDSVLVFLSPQPGKPPSPAALKLLNMSVDFLQGPDGKKTINSVSPAESSVILAYSSSFRASCSISDVIVFGEV